MKKNIAIILSAGNGSRFGSQIPKQFINLAGKNIIEYTIEQFQTHHDIHEICIVANQEFHTKLLNLCEQLDFTKVKKIICGGEDRRDSSFAAITAYDTGNADINLIFHDAVRPFVSHLIITRTIEALKTYDAIDVAIPSSDTIIQVDPKRHIIQNIPQRNLLQRGQTPQAFTLETIKKAHLLAQQDSDAVTVTDDCGLVKYYLPNKEISVVPGEERNIKITYPEDLLFAEKLIQLQSFQLQEDFTNYPELKGKVVIVYGGHSGIGQEIVNICQQQGAFCFAFSRSNDVNIQSLEAVKRSLEDVYKVHSKIDHIVNCAAVLKKKLLKDMTDEDVQEIIGTNFQASINIARLSYSYLKQTHGSLTLFTSSSYTRGRAFYSLYSATKTAIVNFTQAIAQEWQTDNIRVNAINPARTKTHMRIENFGVEPEETLLSSRIVAHKTIQIFLSTYSGLVIDIKKDIDDQI